MIQTLIQNWWLLTLCGVLEALLALINVFMFTWDASPFAINSAAMLSCRLACAAGACCIAAGIWNSPEGKSWPLVLNGLGLSAYGLIPLFWRGPLSHLFASLLAVTALTTGLLSLAIARTLRPHNAVEWFFRGAGTASVGFAMALLALALPPLGKPRHAH